MKPSSTKPKGNRFERELASDLAKAGWLNSRRQPLSGALQGFKGDVVGQPPWYGRQMRFECKSYAKGWPKADAELHSASVLRMPRKGGECLYMSLDTFLAALDAAEKVMPGNLASLLLDSRLSKAKRVKADLYLASGNDGYVIKADHKKPNIYLKRELMQELLDAAGAVREAA